MNLDLTTQHREAPHRAVWLVALVGLGTGAVMLGSVSWSLLTIKADRVTGDIIHSKAAKAISSADEILAGTLSNTSKLLAGKATGAARKFEDWKQPFSESELVEHSSSASMEDVFQSGQDLSIAMAEISRLNRSCFQFSVQASEANEELAAAQKRVSVSIRNLRASIASSEGNALLDLAIKIRKHRSLTGQERDQFASSILETWSPTSTNGEFMTELADLAMLCERLRSEDDIDALVDIKDNRLQPSLRRLKRLVRHDDERNNRQGKNEALLLCVEEALFGDGFKYDLKHQNVELGSGGLYANCHRHLANNNERTQLESEIRGSVSQFNLSRNDLLEALDSVSRASAENAASLITRTWYTMAIVGGVFSLIFIFLATRVSSTIHKQFWSIKEKSAQLAEKTAELQASTDYLELLSLVATHTDNSVVITDLDGNVEWVNPSFERITERQFQDVQGKPVVELLIDENTAAPTRELVQNGLQDKQSFDIEMPCQSRSGATIWLAIEARPIWSANGEFDKFVIVQRDITERQKWEQRLKLLRNAVDNTSDAMFLVSRSGKLADANDVAARQLGYSREELLELNIGDVIKMENWQKTWQRLKDDNHDLIESFQIASDGCETPVEISSSFIQHENEFFICAFSRDVSERKEAEQERQRLNEQLVDASRMAGMAEVATGVLHNVGNILNSVNLSASIIRKQFQTSAIANLEKISTLISDHEDDFAEFVSEDARGNKIPAYVAKVTQALKSERCQMDTEFQDLLNNVDHVKQIVSVQQSMAKSSGLHQELSPEALVADAITANKGTLTNHKVEISTEVSEKIPNVFSDKHRILQILVNLVKNAKDALVENNTPDPQIRISVSSECECIQFAVIDNGVGIPADKIEKIFQHGFTTKKSGHGFGLHASANSATELGGSLTVFSEGPGMGATFKLELPLQSTEEKSESAGTVGATQ